VLVLPFLSVKLAYFNLHYSQPKSCSHTDHHPPELPISLPHAFSQRVSRTVSIRIYSHSPNSSDTPAKAKKIYPTGSAEMCSCLWQGDWSAHVFLRPCLALSIMSIWTLDENLSLAIPCFDHDPSIMAHRPYLDLIERISIRPITNRRAREESAVHAGHSETWDPKTLSRGFVCFSDPSLPPLNWWNILMILVWMTRFCS
jgi:hypothetical protein